MNDTSANPLEDALARAATDPAAGPEFYRRLMEAEVFVLGSMEGTASQRTLEAGEKVSIASWRKGWLQKEKRSTSSR